QHVGADDLDRGAELHARLGIVRLELTPEPISTLPLEDVRRSGVGEALIVVPRDPNSDPALSDRHGGAELDVARTEGAGRQLTLIFQGPSATCPLEDVGGPKVLEQGEVVGK